MLNMRPPEIARGVAARRHPGDVHLGPGALRREEERQGDHDVGRLSASTGACTFDGYIVNKDWAKENHDFMVAFVKALAKADEDYRANPRQWTGDSAEVKAVAKWSGGKPEDVPRHGAVRLPHAQEQTSPDVAGRRRERRGGEGARAAGEFHKEQGRLDDVAPDYSKNVTVEWVTKAM